MTGINAYKTDQVRTIDIKPQGLHPLDPNSDSQQNTKKLNQGV